MEGYASSTTWGASFPAEGGGVKETRPKHELHMRTKCYRSQIHLLNLLSARQLDTKMSITTGASQPPEPLNQAMLGKGDFD